MLATTWQWTWKNALKNLLSNRAYNFSKLRQQHIRCIDPCARHLDVEMIKEEKLLMKSRFESLPEASGLKLLDTEGLIDGLNLQAMRHVRPEASSLRYLFDKNMKKTSTRFTDKFIKIMKEMKAQDAALKSSFLEDTFSNLIHLYQIHRKKRRTLGKKIVLKAGLDMMEVKEQTLNGQTVNLSTAPRQNISLIFNEALESLVETYGPFMEEFELVDGRRLGEVSAKYFQNELLTLYTTLQTRTNYILIRNFLEADRGGRHVLALPFTVHGQLFVEKYFSMICDQLGGKRKIKTPTVSLALRLWINWVLTEFSMPSIDARFGAEYIERECPLTVACITSVIDKDICFRHEYANTYGFCSSCSDVLTFYNTPSTYIIIDLISRCILLEGGILWKSLLGWSGEHGVKSYGRLCTYDCLGKLWSIGSVLNMIKMVLAMKIPSASAVCIHTSCTGSGEAHPITSFNPNQNYSFSITTGINFAMALLSGSLDSLAPEVIYSYLHAIADELIEDSMQHASLGGGIVGWHHNFASFQPRAYMATTTDGDFWLLSGLGGNQQLFVFFLLFLCRIKHKKLSILPTLLDKFPESERWLQDPEEGYFEPFEVIGLHDPVCLQ